ncbi:MAG TPA: flagellar export chaperone FlgN [Capillimicrobium sp.]|nr:flagellar export chaperone FlgN [Capillimicrobium sp.]
MTVLAATPVAGLGAAVLQHLDAQIASARRLLDVVLRQGAAIRRQDVEAVMSCMAELQTEMELRGRLEQHRTELLNRAGAQLGVAGHAITLDALTSLMAAHEVGPARERSAELRGLLAEIQREHTVNRALMRQELAFLDHLTRLLSGAADLGYRPPAERAGANLRVVETPASTHRVLNVEA